MGSYSCLAPQVDCYSINRISTGSHDISHPQLPLVTVPIEIGSQAWGAADVFISPGVRIGEGAVVGARSSVFKEVQAWSVVGGNPARFIKERKITEVPFPSPTPTPANEHLCPHSHA